MTKKIETPIAIVAIFAGLAEVAATTVLAFLPADLQAVFIWYVMLFPTSLLFLFFITWNFNSHVLYSPSHFENDSNFLAYHNNVIKTHEEVTKELMDVLDDDIKSTDDFRSKIDDIRIKLDESLINQEHTYQINNSAPLRIEINGYTVEGSTVPEFYSNILTYLIDHNISFDQLLPVPTGPKRFLVAKKPVHNSGDAFVSPVKIKDYFIETHKSRQGAKKDIMKFLKELNLDINEL